MTCGGSSSPGNPLKAGRTDVAPLSARLESARRVARRSRIIATDIESRLGTRYTVDTVAALIRRYPRRRFIWVMGGDIVGEFHRWRDWRRLARLVPIAIIVRPGYEAITGASPAAVWLRRFVRPTTSASEWTRWRTPAIVLLHCRPDSRSATALRRADPDWYRHIPASPDNRAPPMPRLP